MIIMKPSVTGRRLFVRPRRLPANENKAKTDELEDTLPQSVIDGVKTLMFFLAFSHSGHSIVGFRIKENM